MDFDGVPAALARDRRGYERGFIWLASLEGDGRWREWNSSELIYKGQILSEAVFRGVYPDADPDSLEQALFDLWP
jgi:hypothetical protein